MAEGGTAKIKVNPTQLSEEMGHPELALLTTNHRVSRSRSCDALECDVLGRRMTENETKTTTSLSSLPKHET